MAGGLLHQRQLKFQLFVVYEGLVSPGRRIEEHLVPRGYVSDVRADRSLQLKKNENAPVSLDIIKSAHAVGLKKRMQGTLVT